MAIKYANLVATGSYLPEQVVTNDDMAKRIDTSDQWIRQRTGIRQRYIANEKENVVFMAYRSCLKALEEVEISAKEIDAIIVTSATPDQVFPSIACQLGELLSVDKCFCLDVNAACSGTLYGLSLIKANMQLKKSWSNILLVGVEKMSRVVNWEDRSTSVLFGDGASCMIFKESGNPGLIDVECSSSTKGCDLLYTKKNIKGQDKEYLFMDGKEVYKAAIKNIVDISRSVLDNADILLESVDFCVSHQANERILKQVLAHLGLTQDKMILTIDRHANTSAASIGLALDYAIRNNTVKKGSRLLLNAFGAGFTYGAAILDY